MDAQTGKSFQLLPPAPGNCPVCATPAHPEGQFHNRDSLFYQMQFQQQFGRSPTWADAAAHCSPAVKAALKEALEEAGVPADAIGDFEEVQENYDQTR